MKKRLTLRSKKAEEPESSEDSVVFDDIVRENKNLTVSKFICKYAFMMWDGIGFFAMDAFKLKRLRGRKPGWCD
jgi:hypothetical protein